MITLDSIDVGVGAGDLVLNIQLPDGYKVNGEAPSSVSFTATGEVAVFPDGSEQSLTGANLPVHISVEFTEGEGLVTADVTLLYCRDDAAGLCIIEQVRFEQPVVVGGNGPGVIDLPYTVTLPAFADEN